MKKENKNIQKDKFVYKEGDIKFVTPKKKKKVKEEQILSFTQFLEEKQQNKFVTFNPETMRWITIHDREDKLQHILIKKKDGTILGGMGGTENGNKIGDVFDEIKNEKKEKESIEQFRKNAVTEKEVNKICDIQNIELSEEESKSIRKYTGESYKYINNLLRDTNYKENLNVEERETYSNYIKHISKALQRYKTPEPIITYRGISGSAIKNMMENIKVGNVWKDDGFCSTSSVYNVSQRFSKGDGYTLEVHIPKGSHAASIDSLSIFSEDEYEVLIDKGSEFLIQEVNHDDRRIVVELQQK